MKKFKLTPEIKTRMDELVALSRRINHDIYMNDGCTDKWIDAMQAEYVRKTAELNSMKEYV